MNISELKELLDSKVEEGTVTQLDIEKDNIKAKKGLIAIIGDKHDINNNTIAIGRYFTNNISGAILTPGTLEFREGSVKLERNTLIYTSNNVPDYETLIGQKLNALEEYIK